MSNAEKKQNKADPFGTFATWGEPPEALTKGLTKRQMTLLHRYTQVTADKVYRLAFDNGVSHGLEVISHAADKEWRKQMKAMANS